MVYFSGDEEIKTGIPEEAWPSGVAGNFFRFTDRIISMQATSSALYILGQTYTYVLTGTSTDTFNVRKIASHAGMWSQTPNAACSFLDRVAFLAADGRVMVITGDYVDVISEPIIEATRNSYAVQFHFYSYLNYQWLVILNPAKDPGSYSTIQIYDWTRSTAERRDFWFAPWSGKLNALFPFESASARNLGAITWDSIGPTKSSGLVVMDTTSFGISLDSVRSNGAWSTQSYQWAARIQPFKNPAGNHVNSAAIPQLTTVLGYCKVDYYSGGVTDNIGLTVYYDRSLLTGGTSETARQTSPTRRPVSAGYISREWHFYMVTSDVALQLSPGDLSGSLDVRLDRIAVAMLPGAGPDSSVGGGSSDAS
jgi:hypothetical protein